MSTPRNNSTKSTVNSLTQDPEFQKTALYKCFQEKPLGFVDVGSLGGVHPLMNPAASLVHALCFEPDKKASRSLRRKYAKNSPFARVDVNPLALYSECGNGRKLFVCKTPTNTSLLEPDQNFIRRYKAKKFELDHITDISATTLDTVLGHIAHDRMGEFIKLDTQGSEYEILKGASHVLNDRCVGIWCEIEFFEIYKQQKVYADIDLLLRDYGLFIYGFYPRYRSTKTLSPKNHSSEERLWWADALFLKDPLVIRGIESAVLKLLCDSEAEDEKLESVASELIGKGAKVQKSMLEIVGKPRTQAVLIKRG